MQTAGKKFRAAVARVDRTRDYGLDEAVALVKAAAFAKFDETVDAAVRLGVDPRHADQVVRGTVVLPQADLKVYLTADVDARAARRALEESQRSGSGSVSAAQENLQSRDALDTTRAVSPLQQAADAVAIDGTYLTLDEVIDAVIRALPADAR